MATKLTALVTGGNKGIGLEICRSLLIRGDVHVLLGARDEKRAHSAVNELMKPGGDRSRQQLGTIEFIQLDIDSDQSVSSAERWIREQYGGLDILVNNAGMAFKGDAFDETVARTTLGTNYFGTLRVCRAMLPLIRPNGRVVNVSSMAGRLRKLSPELQKSMMADSLKIDGLSELMNDYISCVADRTFAEKGWPKQTYAVSKIGVSMLTRILSNGEIPVAKGVKINCCCPGWCRTDMAGKRAPKSAAEGAITPVMLCFLADQAPNGKFFTEGKVDEYY